MRVFRLQEGRANELVIGILRDYYEEGEVTLRKYVFDDTVSYEAMGPVIIRGKYERKLMPFGMLGYIKTLKQALELLGWERIWITPLVSGEDVSFEVTAYMKENANKKGDEYGLYKGRKNSRYARN